MIPPASDDDDSDDDDDTDEYNDDDDEDIDDVDDRRSTVDDDNDDDDRDADDDDDDDDSQNNDGSSDRTVGIPLWHTVAHEPPKALHLTARQPTPPSLEHVHSPRNMQRFTPTPFPTGPPKPYDYKVFWTL